MLYPEEFTPEEEITSVVRSLARWLPDNADKTVAVLTPRNDRGAQVVRALKLRGLEVVELLQKHLFHPRDRRRIDPHPRRADHPQCRRAAVDGL
ncbi:hypothetical protein HC928_21835 [bacterium]|nr:hypothetical protein [bacterium]